MQMTAADDLLAFLEEENTALRAGQLDGLAEKVARKEALSVAFAQSMAPVPRAKATALREAAERNERLLRAAREGLRRAVDRWHERRRAGTQLETYDAAGRRRSIPAGVHRLERRS
jgi:hypothetical protein